MSNSELKQLLSPIADQIGHVWTRDIFAEVFANHENQLETPSDFVNHSLYFEARTFLHGLFIVEDKLSMAHSLENRVPFMDNDLVDFAMSCPVSLKIGKLEDIVRIDENMPGSKTVEYFAQTSEGKQILRTALGQNAPDAVRVAKKQGFSAPDASWFRGESIDYVRTVLFSSSSKIGRFVDMEALASMVDEHLQGERNRRLMIWSFLNLEAWTAQYL